MVAYFSGILLAMSLMASLPFSAIAATDSEAPSDVENLVVLETSNQAVKLKWDAATDNTGVAGYVVYYGLSPVTKSGETYDFNKDTGKVTTYTVTGLTNDEKYYFSVIAYDAAGNESANWAYEVSATPKSEAGEDNTAPQVAKAEALNEEEVKVVFTEAVILPTSNAEDSFLIENNDTFEPLSVISAELDEEDISEKTVTLTTAKQDGEAEYTLTVGIDIKDKAGNFVISGTSDTAVFDGSADEKGGLTPADLQMEEVEQVDATSILLHFNKKIVLSLTPEEDFEIAEKDDETKTLTITAVELGENTDGVEDAAALITFEEELTEGTSYIVTTKVTDEDGNEIAAEDNEIDFTYGENEDTTPPKDVDELLAKAIFEAGKYIVKLTWDMPAENEGDTKIQKLYMADSEDGDYSKDASLEAEDLSHEVKDLEPGEYWFKLTQEDEAGNESEGTKVKIVLSETGPEMLGLLFVSIGLGRMFGKKKKK